MAQDEIITTTPDCCKAWPAFARRFHWLAFTDHPDMACMPHVPMRDKDTGEIHQWRVQHCPSCGADRRDVVMLADEVC